MNLKQSALLILSCLAKVFCNPFCFLLYFLLFPAKGFLPTNSTNVVTLHFMYYIFFSLFYTGISFLLFSFLNWFLFPKEAFGLTLMKKFINFNGRILVSWILTYFILDIYRTGMEGNIMGFIGFPLLLLALCFQVASNAHFVKSLFQAEWESRILPLAEKFQKLSPFSTLFLSVLLHPFTVYLFHSLHSEEKINPMAMDIPLEIISAFLITSTLMIFYASILWGIRSFLMKGISYFFFLRFFFSRLHALKFLSAIIALSLFLLIFIAAKFGYEKSEIVSLAIAMGLMLAFLSSIKTIQLLLNRDLMS